MTVNLRARDASGAVVERSLPAFSIGDRVVCNVPTGPTPVLWAEVVLESHEQSRSYSKLVLRFPSGLEVHA